MQISIDELTEMYGAKALSDDMVKEVNYVLDNHFKKLFSNPLYNKLAQNAMVDEISNNAFRKFYHDQYKQFLTELADKNPSVLKAIIRVSLLQQIDFHGRRFRQRTIGEFINKANLQKDLRAKKF